MATIIETMVARSKTSSIFSQRLREARERMGIAQDRLGVMIGLDEGSASARMSRYESGVHEPPYSVVQKIATSLNVPVPYLYCEDNDLAALILRFAEMTDGQRKHLLNLAINNP